MKTLDYLRSSINKSSKIYIGQKEIKGNQGFVNKWFQKKMEAVGFVLGQAWCSYFAELVWCEGYGRYNSFLISKIQKLFSANAIETFNNFVADGFESNQTAEIGDLVIWQSYSKGSPRKSGKWYLGHIGVVSEVFDNGFKSVEGNTNSSGGREGIEVAEKTRKYTFETNNGLRLIGFIKPKIMKS